MQTEQPNNAPRAYPSQFNREKHDRKVQAQGVNWTHLKRAIHNLETERGAKRAEESYTDES